MRSNRRSLVLSSCVVSWPQGHTPLSAPVFWERGPVLTHFPVSVHGYKVSASSTLIKYMLIIILVDAECHFEVPPPPKNYLSDQV